MTSPKRPMNWPVVIAYGVASYCTAALATWAFLTGHLILGPVLVLVIVAGLIVPVPMTKDPK